MNLPTVEQADQSVRRKHDDYDQHDAEDQLPGVDELSRSEKSDRLEHRGAGERTCCAGGSTQDGDKDKFAGFGPVSEFRRCDLLRYCDEYAAEAAEKGRKDISDAATFRAEMPRYSSRVSLDLIALSMWPSGLSR